MSLLILVPLAALFELTWRASDVLRARRRQFRVLLAVFWLLTLGITVGHRTGGLPAGWFYEHGALRFASDAQTYHLAAVHVAERLGAGAPGVLLDRDVTVYSRILGLLYRVFGADPLVGMLFNAVAYVTVLVAVYLLARAMFDEPTGVVSVWLVGLWPTFLLHMTQTLRWTLTTAAFAVVMTALVLFLRGSRATPLWPALAAGYAVLLFDVPYIARLLWVATVIVAVVLLAFALRRRERLAAATATAVVALVLFLVYEAAWMRPAPSGPPQETIPATAPGPLAGVLEERNRFFLKPEVQGSATNFAGARPMVTLREFVENLPEAYRAALFAPFPGMLLSDAPGESRIRRYVIVEMLAYYALLPFVVAGVVLALRRADARLSTLFVVLFLVGFLGLLGTVVMNAGTLHRLRLPSVLLLMTFAAAGLRAATRATGIPLPARALAR